MTDPTLASLNLPGNVHFLRRDWFNSNSLLITGSPTVLIDSGGDKGIAFLQQALQEHGVVLNGIDLVLATHGHADHVGAASVLQKLHGTPVAMHEYEAYYVNRDDEWWTWRTPHGTRFEQLRVDVPLHDGEVLQLDGLSLVALHTPGHSSGGISYYCPEHRFLATGDAVWEKAVGVIDVSLEGGGAPLRAREAVRKLMALDVTAVFPGHGRAILNPAENFDAALAYVDGLLDDPRKMAYDLIWRVLVFSLYDRGDMGRDTLLSAVCSLPFFTATNRLFFKVSDDELLESMLRDLQKNGLVRVVNGMVRLTRDRPSAGSEATQD